MSTSDSALEKNKQELEENLISEFKKEAFDIGLDYVLYRLVGAPATVIKMLISLLRSQRQMMYRMAQQSLRDEYGDNRIHVMGLQVAGNFSSEESWSWVHRAGGTLWVQDVLVTKSEALTFAVFWHPDFEFKLKKNIIRVYRGRTQCTEESERPQLKAGR